MDPLTLLVFAAIAAGGYYLLTEGEALAAQPSFDPASLAQFTDVIDGVRVFKPDVAAKLKVLLHTKGVRPVDVSGNQAPPGLLLETIPISQTTGGANASDTIDDATAMNLVVLGSLSLILQNDPSPKLLLIVSKDKRSFAAPDSKFAVLAETTAAQTGVPVPPKPPFDAGMPADVVAMVNAALSDPNLSPEALDAMAAELDKDGFPIAAKALRDRAAAIRLKQQAQDQNAGGTPFTIRATSQGNAADLPFNVAKFYTGDGNRWREIPPVNSQLGMVIKDSQFGPIPDPWKAGLTVLLPLSWEARGKGLPPVANEPKSNGVPPGVDLHPTFDEAHPGGA